MVKHDIFISYSKKDSEFAIKLADDLVNAGHKIWLDRSLQVGEEWEQTIEKKLEEVEEVIVLLSPNSIASNWVQHEGSMAYALGKSMFPVLIGDVPAENLPIWVGKFQYHSFLDVDYEVAFDALNNVLTPPNPIQDLLDQQVNAYNQTGDLIGATILKVIEEAFDTLVIDSEAKELIEKSQQEIKAIQQKELEQQQRLNNTRRQRTIVLTIGLIIAVILTLISFSLYQQSNQNLNNANIANTKVFNEQSTAVAERSTAQAASTQAVLERDAAEIARDDAEYQQSLAEEQAKRAKSRELAVISLNKLESEFDLAVLLSVESIGKEDNFLSRSSLSTVARYNPNLLNHLHRHTDNVNSVAFSPDGKMLASGGWDKTIRLWNPHTGQQIREPLTGHTYSIDSMAFSPDGEMLASGSFLEIWLWNPHTGQQIGEPLRGQTGSINSVAFSPDGKILASGSCGEKSETGLCIQGEIRLWDPHTGQQIGEPLKGHTGSINSVAFSPDGEMLASGSCGEKGETGLCIQGEIRLWNLHSGQQIGEPLIGHTADILTVAFSPDGEMLASGGVVGTIRLWNPHTGQQIGEALTGHTGGINSMAFSPDGEMLASGSNDYTIRLWNPHTAQQIGEPLTGHTDSIFSVAFSPDGEMLASGSWDDTIRLWDPRMEQHIGEALTGHTGHVNSVAFSSDGEMLASGSCGDRDKYLLCIQGEIRLWDADTGQQIGEPLTGHTDIIYSVAFSPDGEMLASSGNDYTIYLWDPHTGQQIGEPLTGHTDSIYSVVFSPDGKMLASGSNDNTIRLWDPHTGQQIGEPLGHTGDVRSVAFSPDGEMLASGSYDKTIRLWDPHTGQQIGEPLTGHMDNIDSVAFSPDGEMLASGSWDETIRLWDPHTGQQIGEPLRGHTGWVKSVVFSPDGRMLASGSSDDTIRLWDPHMGQQIGEPLTGYTNIVSNINNVAFSPDGEMLAGGSNDYIIWLFDTDIESWINAACQRASRNLTENEWLAFFPGECYRQTCGQFSVEYEDNRVVCKEDE